MKTVFKDLPAFKDSDISSILNDIYGIKGKAKSLPGEWDKNFHITTSDGEFVLKISNELADLDFIELQNNAIDFINAKINHTPMPKVIRSKKGESISESTSAVGKSHYLRLLSFVKGIPMGSYSPHTRDMIYSTGKLLGDFDKVFKELKDDRAKRHLTWDLKNASEIIENNYKHISSKKDRDLVKSYLEIFNKTILPQIPKLRKQIIHSDGNDFNVIVCDPEEAYPQNIGLIDFGDLVHTCTVFEPAIAAAYAILGKNDPLIAASELIRGYHNSYKLKENELGLILPLITARLSVSVCMSAKQLKMEPDNKYLTISQKPAWEMLHRLKNENPRKAEYLFRSVCGYEPHPKNKAISAWMKKNKKSFAPLIDLNKNKLTYKTLDCSPGSSFLENDDAVNGMEKFSGKITAHLKAHNADIGLGFYNEPRLFYSGEQFYESCDDLFGQRTIHIGTDVFVKDGTPIQNPYEGVVYSFSNNNTFRDYGPTIILEHKTSTGEIFYTLFGHLTADSVANIKVGQKFETGETIARIGNISENGGWPPHLHYQIILEIIEDNESFTGVTSQNWRDVYTSVCPDPNLIMDLPKKLFSKDSPSKKEILEKRKKHICNSLSLSYNKPLQIERGIMQYLFDEHGIAYLDAVNNVPHVGHGHPKVVEAMRSQAGILNTNSRYLHKNIVQYAEKLCDTFPDSLEVCYFTNSGSEANELALRLAKAHTGSNRMIAVGAAYHGNTQNLIDISSYKFDGKGGTGKPGPNIKTVNLPDIYRGKYKGNTAGKKYGADVKEAIKSLQKGKSTPINFICESLPGCGGQIVLPNGYLKEVYKHIRNTGGVCIVDEVQVGFGRVGTHFWGFETHDVTPEIVTLGKPMGNGHPIGAVITTRGIAESFANGMEYFNTYGGNPVSCAVGMAVLEVIQESKLQKYALSVGNYLSSSLSKLAQKHKLIGDVRGRGLYLGVELVLDRKTLEPAAEQAEYIANRMKDHGILISTDGPLHNVLKIKPPLVFTKDNADKLVHCLDKILSESFVTH